MINGDVCIGIAQRCAGNGSSVDHGSNRGSSAVSLGKIYRILPSFPTLLFLFCFNSCIYNPLHAARRAMAAAKPLPSRGQRRVF